ncbi:MAG: pyridine nucleotide-disulfide oxidoreductase dimerization region [Pseudonocardiales bacterium]|nr:pyridine nucleotide-disulfide oxidoreductase dimerization region [Pseudonocardiales bacterium]
MSAETAGSTPEPGTVDATDEWDVIVIGAGPPGENAAQYAIQGSDRTAVLVEAHLVGGECSYYACMPSKGLLRPVELARQAANLPGLAGRVGPIDVPAVLGRRDQIINNLDDTSQVDWAKGANIAVLRGHGRLAGPKTVIVETSDGPRTIRARHAVVLSTGTTASVPPTPGLGEALPWTSRDVTNLHEIPRRVVVVGGGVVASEASTWLSGLGAEVTMIVRGGSLLANNEPFAGELVADNLRSHGVHIRFDANLESVSRPDVEDTGLGQIHGGSVEVVVDGETITADEIVVATGRTPASANLGLSSVGLKDEGYVDSDDHLEVTGVDGQWLYAIGDLTGKALLTHMGKYQARLVGAVIAARAKGKSVDGTEYTDLADHGIVPQVTFTDPQVASVGRTEKQARGDGVQVGTAEYDMANVAGAYLVQENYVGRAKLVVDTGTDLVVGATFVGPDVADLVHAATIAIVGKVPLSLLWHAVPSYPTVSEIWLRLLETYRSE